MRFLKLIAVAGIVILAGLVLLWWEGRPPKRPSNLPSNAIYIEIGFLLRVKSTPGKWVGCWFDAGDKSDHCRITDEKGKLEFEGVFLPYEGARPVPQSALIFDTRSTGGLWVGSYEKGIHVPAIYLTNGQILLPEAAFEESKRAVGHFH